MHTTSRSILLCTPANTSSTAPWSTFSDADGLYLPISSGRKANSILRFRKHLRKTILHALRRLITSLTVATVNEVIAHHLPVTTEFITQEEATGRFDMKRLPEGASETVRVVHVGDYDECLCIGQHVENTSEIGTFKIISHDFNDGIFRMRFKLV